MGKTSKTFLKVAIPVVIILTSIVWITDPSPLRSKVWEHHTVRGSGGLEDEYKAGPCTVTDFKGYWVIVSTKHDGVYYSVTIPKEGPVGRNWVDRETEFHGPDYVYINCHKYLPALPADVLRKFKGYYVDAPKAAPTPDSPKEKAAVPLSKMDMKGLVQRLEEYGGRLPAGKEDYDGDELALELDHARQKVILLEIWKNSPTTRVESNAVGFDGSFTESEDGYYDRMFEKARDHVLTNYPSKKKAVPLPPCTQRPCPAMAQ